MHNLGIFDITIGYLWTVLVTLFVTPTIIRVAYFRSLFDVPDYRKLHDFPIPRGGGFAVFTSFMVGLISFVHMEEDAQKVLGPAMLIFLLGFKDDMSGAVAKRKLVIQVLAASMAIIVVDVRILSLHGLMGIYVLPLWGSYALSYLVVLATTNAFNLIDGINGLLASVSILVCIVLGVLLSPYRMDLASMAWILSAALVAFLKYNLRKPQIFMGDSGSLTCGFLLSLLAMFFLREDNAATGIPQTLALLFLPAFDLIRTCCVRLLAGRAMLAPGKDHIHHALMRVGFSQFQTLLILLTTNMAVYLLCLTFSFADINLLVLALVMTGLLLHVAILALGRCTLATSSAT